MPLLNLVSFNFEQQIDELYVVIPSYASPHSPEQLCMPGKVAQYSRARAMLAIIVREVDSISLENLAEFLKRDPSTLAQLASKSR